MHASGFNRDFLNRAGVRRRKRLLGAGLIALLVLVIGSTARPAHNDARVRRAGDDLFLAAGEIDWRSEISGDALVAGGEIDLRGNIHGDAVVAGGQVRAASKIDEDLYAAGGEVKLSGEVGGSARIAGGQVEITPDAVIGGGASIVGGRVLLDGSVDGYAQVAAGSIRVDGRVNGDLSVFGRELALGPNAVVQGKLSYRGPTAPEIAAGAQVMGGVDYTAEEAKANWIARFTQVGWLLWLLGWLIAGAVLLLFAPNAMRRVTQTLRARSWQAPVLGILILAVVPIVVVLLSVTVIGIPLALIVLAAYVMLVPLGLIAAAAAIGDWLLDRFSEGERASTAQRVLALMAALLALFLLVNVPYAGGLLVFIAMLFGIGAIVLALFSPSLSGTLQPAA